MNKEIEDVIAEQEKHLDELFFQVGDVLDVKASIILVVISFLGAISSQILLVQDLSCLIKGLQILAVLALAGGVFTTVWSLWPRVFDAPPNTEEWIEYLQELEKFYAGQEDSAERAFKAFKDSISKRRQERISKNRALAERKSNLNSWAFRATVVAASAEAICLVWLAFWHLLK
jgi:hypothetical protein